jgi:hypothetical protein
MISIGSCVAAFMSYSVNELNLKDVQRAYTTVDCEPVINQDFITYRIFVKNLGNTPALNVTADTSTFGVLEVGRIKDMQTIGPKESKMLVKIDLRREIAQTSKFGMKGYINYSDIFGKSQSEYFCFQTLGQDIYICDNSKTPSTVKSVN